MDLKEIIPTKCPRKEVILTAAGELRKIKTIR